MRTPTVSGAIDRRSVSGEAVMSAGAGVCWFSRNQKRMTLSATEPESLFIVLTDTIKGAMFKRYVWSSIWPGFGASCITVFEVKERGRQLAQNAACTPIRSTSTHDTTSEEGCGPGGV